MVMMLLRQFTVAEVGKAIGRPERWQCDGKYWRMDSMDDATQHSGLPELQPEDLRDLEYALELVDSPGLIARLSDLIGSPIEAMLKRLPDGAARIIDAASSKALWAALKVAAGSLPRHRASFVSHDRRHRILSGISGAVGGAFGLPALGIELPVTTTLIMRSIAEIAQCEGEDLRDPAVGMACMEVFAFGGEQPGDDATESGYFAVRAALARAVNEAAQYIGRQGSIREGAPRWNDDMAQGYGLEEEADEATETYAAPEPLGADVASAAAAYFGEGMKLMTADALFENLNDGDDSNDPFIISICKPEDYQIGHVPGAVNIGAGGLFGADAIAAIPSNGQVVVYCYTGQTAGQVTAALNMLGYDAYSLKFGSAAWAIREGAPRWSDDMSMGYPLDTEAHELP